RTEARLLTTAVLPYSKTTCPRETIIIASVWCVLMKARRASRRAEENPSDSGEACSHSTPGRTYPWPSLKPSGGRSGAGLLSASGAAGFGPSCAAEMAADTKTQNRNVSQEDVLRNMPNAIKP